MERKDIKQLCDESVEENLEHLSNIASYLYMNPEIAFQEHKACKVLCLSVSYTHLMYTLTSII